jgi:hypothetical protein
MMKKGIASFKTRRVISAALACMALLVSTNNVAHCEQRQELRRSFDLRPGATVSLENISGDITITSWAEPRAEVVAVKTGPAEQLDDVDIAIDAQPSRLGIRTIYPERGSSQVSVSFSLKVPRRVNLDAIKSISGDVEIAEIEGRVVASSVSGSVKVRQVGQEADLNSVSGDANATDVAGNLDANSVSGDVSIVRVNAHIDAGSVSGSITISESNPTGVKASTVSGDIRFHGGLQANGRYEMKSHSGTVEARLPSDSTFALQASTFSGSIDSDFEIQLQGRLEKRSVSGTVGPGGPTLELRSFSGSVRLKVR